MIGPSKQMRSRQHKRDEERGFEGDGLEKSHWNGSGAWQQLTEKRKKKSGDRPRGGPLGRGTIHGPRRGMDWREGAVETGRSC